MFANKDRNFICTGIILIIRCEILLSASALTVRTAATYESANWWIWCLVFIGCEDYLGEISCPETGMVHSSVEWVTGINDCDLDANAKGQVNA